MRLSVIGPTYPYKGGISQFTTLLVKILRQRNNRVDFMSWNHQYPAFLYPVEQKDTASKQNISVDSAPVLNFYNPFSWIRGAWRVKRHQSDRLIITWITIAHAPVYLVLVGLVRVLTGCRVTHLCHNVISHEPTFADKLLTKLCFGMAHDFIVHSQQDATDLRRLVGDKPITVAFHPTFEVVSPDAMYDVGKLKRQLKLKKHVLLFFGYVRAYKGLDGLLKSLPAIVAKKPDTSLLVVGEFWQHDKPTYEALVRELHMEDHVVFVDGYVPNEAIERYFAVADLMVAPYVSATQSGVVQMAYAFDTPVVATRVGGLPDAIDEGVSGMLCPPQNTKKLAETTLRALDYRKFDVAKTKQRFSWQHYAELLEL